MKKYKNNIIAIILSLILVIFVWHKFLVSGNSVILILIFISSYYFLKKVIENENKRKFIITSIIAIVFAIIEVICTSINFDYTLNHIVDKWLIVNLLGYGILAWSITSTIYTILENQELANKPIKIGKISLLSDTKLAFLINVILILIAWIPYFLRYYPGLLTADSCAQMAQALGIATLSNHHPIFHTVLIALFVNLGKVIFGNVNAGVAVYTIFQMIMMAIMFSAVIHYASKKNVPIIVRVVILLYYMFYPINALFSVTMWKDVLFAGIVPIFIILCTELIFDTEDFLSKKRNIIIYMIVSILVFFMRNNGIYAVVLSMPFIAIALRKYWKKVVPMFLGIIIIYFGLKTVIFSALNIKNGSVAEMLSIPLQQIARVQKYYGDELDDETKAQINNFFKCENIGEKYNPILSDPVKAELDTSYFNENKVEFIKLWLKLLRGYFKDYVESFISNSYGYYYPEASHWVANRTMEQNNMGLEQTPVIDGKLVSKVDSLIERRDIPLLSMCFSIGTAFWLIVICLGYKILKKEYKYILIYLPIFILWLTIVASPVFCEYRYAYSLFTTLPLYISLNFVKRKEIENGKNSSTNTML